MSQESLVNSLIVGDQGSASTSGPGTPNPIIKSSPTGAHVLVWTSFDGSQSKTDLYFQLYDPQGNKVGSETKVETGGISSTHSNVHHPSIDFFSDGSFIIAWDTGASGDDEVYAQIFSSDGTASSSTIPVSIAQSFGAQRVPSVTILENDTAFISYSKYMSSNYHIVGSTLDKSGNFISQEIPISPTGEIKNSTESEQVELADGKIAVVYNSYAVSEIHLRISASNDVLKLSSY